MAPSTRRKIASTASSATGWTWRGVKFGGRAAFVVATAILFYGVPFALSLVEEGQLAEMEKEAKMREAGNEVRLADAVAAMLLRLNLGLTIVQMLTAGSSGSGGQDAAKPAL